MKYRLLIADDLEDSADSLALLMQSAGHQVETAYDGEAALRLAESQRPDAALLDIEMPKLTGYEVCRRIREQPWGKAMILIALSGCSRDETHRQVEESGFDLQMVKPIDHVELVRVLQRLAGERESRSSH